MLIAASLRERSTGKGQRQVRNPDRMRAAIVDMQRHARFAALPKDPVVIRFDVDRECRFMLLKATEDAL
jgi:hypothetical protein